MRGARSVAVATETLQRVCLGGGNWRGGGEVNVCVVCVCVMYVGYAMCVEG